MNIFHQTLLYMLLQGAGVPNGTLPPPGFATPQWEVLAEQWDAVPPTVDPTVILGPETIVLGHDDPEDEDEDPEKATILDGVEFGWDNEHPRREVEVKQFRISWRPVTNGEFYKYWKEDGKGKVSMPASWIECDGGVQVSSTLRYLLHEIHYLSVRSVHCMARSAWRRLRTGQSSRHMTTSLSTRKCKADVSLPNPSSVYSMTSLSAAMKAAQMSDSGTGTLFREFTRGACVRVDCLQADVSYYTCSATTGGSKGSGKGHNGGVWEWTSTVFDNYEGFVSSKLYPGYVSSILAQSMHLILQFVLQLLIRLLRQKAYGGCKYLMHVKLCCYPSLTSISL